MDHRIRMLLKIIEQWQEPIQLTSKESASQVGLSEAHFLRLFHKGIRMSFRCYVRKVKMGRAAELVQDGTLPIKGIAYSCGYTDVSNFYRDFKQVHGITPVRMRIGCQANVVLSQDVLP